MLGLGLGSGVGGFKQTPQLVMVIGTFALFLKTDNETIFMSFFHIFSHKFKLLDKVEIDIALTGTWEKFCFCLLVGFF